MNHEEQKACGSVSVWWQKYGKDHPMQTLVVIGALVKRRRLPFKDAYEFACQREDVLKEKGQVYVDETVDFLKLYW